MIGRSILHYEILEKLGAGGMGVVYKARDTHLDRYAAIKVLPPEAVADPERQRRFVQEARAASALDHPNIITIYDIGHQDGFEFIAMEYVAGRTLEDLIRRKGLRLSDFLSIAVQIADALARAHAAGIVHRDLKPSNIMVDEHDLVKVLDFGLAKLVPAPEPPELAETRTLGSPSTAHTDEAVIVGTAGYMSPEQAQGMKLDARSDIFSLGAVLYEMITGQHAFQGDTRLSILTAVLREEPKPIHELNPSVPAELERIISRCLRKDPQWRFQHMEDLKVALAELKQESDSGKLARSLPAAPVRLRRRWRWSAAGVLALVILAGLVYWLGRAANPLQEIRLSQLTWDSGLTTQPAISPDGKLVAYASDRSGKGNLEIWIQQMGGEPVRLTSGDADDHEPSFSPDGTRIAFRYERAGGGVYVVPSLGGEPRLVARQGRRPRFSPDGRWIAYYVSSSPSRTFAGPAHPSAIYVVSSTGGNPWRLQPSFPSAHDPVWTPDGRIIFTGMNQGRSANQLDLWITPWNPADPLQTSQAIQTGAAELLVRRRLFISQVGDWAGDRVVLSARFAGAVNLWELRINRRSGKVRDRISRLTAGSSIEDEPSLAATGQMVFSSLATMPDIWSIPLRASGGEVAGAPERLTGDPAMEMLPTLSADGRKLAFISNRMGNTEVWLRDLETGKEQALTASPQPKFSAVISRDGSRVAYGAIDNRTSKIYVISTSGGVPEVVCNACGPPEDWSADGARLLFQIFRSDTGIFTVGLLDLTDGQRMELLEYPGHSLFRAHFSLDGHWIAVHADNPQGVTQEMIIPFRPPSKPAAGDWIPVTDGATFDDTPRWSPDGKLLYYLSDRDGFRCVWAQRLHPQTMHPLGAPFPVQHFHTMRSSPRNVDLSALDIFVAEDKMVINLGETRGNIWLANP